MSATAVPLQPIAKGSLPRFWIGIVLVVLAALALSWCTVASVREEFRTSDEILASIATEDGVEETGTGLLYREIDEGTGPAPSEGDGAVIAYEGKLADGTEFDKNDNAQFIVQTGQAIPGFIEGLKQVKKGGTAEFWIPPELGYGDTDVPNPQTGEIVIPANSILHFTVTLKEITPAAEVRRQMEEQMKLQQQLQEQMGQQGGGAPQGQVQ